MFETEADFRLKTVSAFVQFNKVFQVQNWDRLQIKNMSQFQKRQSSPTQIFNPSSYEL